MAKTLACRVGRHQWDQLFQQEQEFTVCVACGKELKPKAARRCRAATNDVPGRSPVLTVRRRL